MSIGKVIITRHVDCEGPGYLLNVLERNNLPWQVIKIDEGESVPENLEGVLALVSMGGGMSVNDDLAWIEQECQLIRLAGERGVPVLGHCLGAQLIAKALGARIYANREKEIGWFDLNCRNEHKLFKGIDFPLAAFHWHGETFDLPQGATNLAYSELCENQCFVKDNMIGFQCHIEMTQALVEEWVFRFSEQLVSDHKGVQNSDHILENISQKVADLNHSADCIYQNWIDDYIK